MNSVNTYSNIQCLSYYFVSSKCISVALEISRNNAMHCIIVHPSSPECLYHIYHSPA